MGTKRNFARRSRDGRRTSRLLQFQTLEQRLVMDARSVLSSVGDLTIDAGSHASDVQVFDVWNRVVVSSRDASGRLHNSAFDRTLVKELVFKGSDLADKFTNTTGIPDRIWGGESRDKLIWSGISVFVPLMSILCCREAVLTSGG